MDKRSAQTGRRVFVERNGGAMRFDVSRRALMACAAVLLVSVATILSINLWRDRERSVELTTITCRNIAHLLAQQVTAMARNADMTLMSLSGALQRAANPTQAELDALLAQHREMLPESTAVLVFDRDGNLRAGGRPGQRANIADRGYFRGLRDGSITGLAIGEPVLGRVSEVWLLPFARRILGPDGRFAGITLASIELRHLESLIKPIRLGADGVVALRDDQLRLILRYPEPQAYGVDIGQKPNQEIVWRVLREGLEEHAFGAPSSVDRIERVFVMRKVRDFPFYVFVGQSITDGLREWRLTAWISLGVFLFFAAVTSLFTALINRSWKQQERALADARDAQQRYQSVLAAMSEAVVVEDAGGNVIAHNPAAAAVLGDPRAGGGKFLWDDPGWRIIDEDGQPYPRERLPWRLTRRSGAPQDAVVLGLERGGAPLRWLSVNVRAIAAAGGRDAHTVVSTLTDITRRKEADSELLLAASVYRSSGEAIMVVDSGRRVLSVNPAFTRITGFEAADVLGRVPDCLAPLPQHGAGLLDCLAREGGATNEVWCRRKSGDCFPVWATVDVLQDERGARDREIVMFTDISDRKQAEETIWRQANYDPLTGLANRSLFSDRLQQELNQAQRQRDVLALLFVDLDHFKEVNDSFGHQYGDQLLREAATRLRECVRSADTVARFGGDEFAILAPRLASIEQATVIAANSLEALAKPFTLGIDITYVSASVGITVFPNDGADVETLLRNADQAMYSAKDAGRNTYAFFTPAMQQAARERQKLHNDMHAALRGGQFEVYIQPIVALAGGAVVKAEALLRWWHPLKREYISPAQFIPLAEDFGLIGELGEFVFRSAALAAKRWLDAGLGKLQIGINVSPRQFAAAQMPDGWLEWLAQIGMPCDAVLLEITESLLLDERREPRQKLARCRGAGMQVAIDDFGTGYSSLAYLKRLDVDLLKIDRSFVRDLEHDANDRALVEAIIVMAHKLGIAVVAEGVETGRQRDFLLRAGCDFAQGYFFAKPMPLDAFAEWLRQAGHAAGPA